MADPGMRSHATLSSRLRLVRKFTSQTKFQTTSLFDCGAVQVDDGVVEVLQAAAHLVLSLD